MNADNERKKTNWLAWTMHFIFWGIAAGGTAAFFGVRNGEIARDLPWFVCSLVAAFAIGGAVGSILQNRLWSGSSTFGGFEPEVGLGGYLASIVCATAGVALAIRLYLD